MGEETVRVVVADDSVLLREGLVTPARRGWRSRSSGRRATAKTCCARCGAHRRTWPWSTCRMPPTSRRRGPAAPRIRSALAACPDVGRAGPLAVRRGARTRRRLLADGSRGRRLPAQGPCGRGRPLHRRGAPGRRGRLGRRPGGGAPLVLAARVARIPWPQLTPREARGARADGRGPVQPRDQPAHVRHRRRGGAPRDGHLRQARPGAPGPEHHRRVLAVLQYMGG